MKNLKIFLPRKLTLGASLKFVEYLRNLPEVDEYIFNFGDIDWSEPFGLLAVSSEINKCMRKFPSAKFISQGHVLRTYEGHMGFFESFGIHFGKKPGEVIGGSSYIPIKIVPVDMIRKRASDSVCTTGDIIEQDANQIAKVLTQERDLALVEVLTYSIREIIRNVIEHSESSQYGYCAQYWPSQSWVEFSLLDRGVGIKKTLMQNPRLEISNDKEAIKLSIMPCISSKSYKGGKFNHSDIWANSGFGLYMTSRICGNGGSFFITSGFSGIILNEKRRWYIKTNFKGTALRLCLNTNKIDSFKEIIDRYRKEGLEIAKRYRDKVHISASTASQLLSKDFHRRNNM